VSLGGASRNSGPEDVRTIRSPNSTDEPLSKPSTTGEGLYRERMAHRIRASLLAVAAGALVGTLSGCGFLTDSQPPGYVVVNDTARTISVTDDSGQRMNIPPGESRGIYAAKCRDNVRVMSDQWTLLAEAHNVCDGDKWTIRGPGDTTLER
jgi:hypothetical protein